MINLQKVSFAKRFLELPYFIRQTSSTLELCSESDTLFMEYRGNNYSRIFRKSKADA